jgi:hypothetical protein
VPSADNPLTEPEQRLCDATPTGTIVNLRTDSPERDDPATGQQWGRERSIRAQLLYDLLTGTEPSRPRPRALHLRGARITGTLDLEAMTLLCPLTLQDCYLDQPIVLADARVLAIRLPGTHINPPPGTPALNGQQLETRGNLELDQGFTATGEIRLPGAHIGGTLDFSSATLTNPEGQALSADRLTVDQDMLCRQEFTATGEIRLLGAHIGGTLAFSGATLINPKGRALTADNLTVGSSMFCYKGFSATGEIRLLGARIGGQLNLTRATLTNPNRTALTADGITVAQGMYCIGFTAAGEIRLPGGNIGLQLVFNDATLTNPEEVALDLESTTSPALFLRTAAAPDGAVVLSDARIRNLYDSQDTWPKILRVDGFNYDTLEAQPSVDAKARLRWLELHPGDYSPQPYEQLIAAYRRVGNEQAARTVAIAKQRRRRRELTKEKAERWTRWRAFTQVRPSSNIQLLPYSLVTLPVSSGTSSWSGPSATATAPGRPCWGWPRSWLPAGSSSPPPTPATWPRPSGHLTPAQLSIPRCMRWTRCCRSWTCTSRTTGFPRAWPSGGPGPLSWPDGC